MTQPAAQPYHIVIADDDALMRHVLASMLAHAYPRARVTVTENGQEALRAAAGAGADLVLADRSMPLMDGIALIGALRSAGVAAPVIILLGEPTFGAAALAAGAAGTLLKPFDLAELEQAVAPHLAGA